jgi:hypothetical protein
MLGMCWEKIKVELLKCDVVCSHCHDTYHELEKAA